MKEKGLMKKTAILYIVAILSLAGCREEKFDKLAIQNAAPEPVAGINRYYHTDDGNYKIPGIERIKSIRTEPLWQSEDLDWMKWVVTNIQPCRPGNHLSYEPLLSYEEKMFWVENFDPDLFDWWSGVPMNRGEFSHLRGIGIAGGMEYEYEAALHGVHGFGPDIFEGNGLGVTLDGSYSSQAQYQNCKEMTHMSPKWHSLVKSGNVRYAMYGDSAAQDNIIHGVHIRFAQFDDWSNRRFIEYMTGRYSKEHIKSIGFDGESFHIRNPVVIGLIPVGASVSPTFSPLR